MIHSFLLIGQSNAAGRGFLPDAEPLNHFDGHLKVLRNGRWLNMFRPVNPDRRTSGVCFAESFAGAYWKDHPDVQVGIIPCADGGTQVEQWLPGEILFENAVFCAKLAMRTSSLCGVLWHQGEGDSHAEKTPLYAERFTTVMNALRKELGIPNLPILVGGLGDFLKDYNTEDTSDNAVCKNYMEINRILREQAQVLPHCAFVSAEGLSANPDNLHFSAQALQEFGLRYYKAWEPFDSIASLQTAQIDESANIRSAMELL